MNNPLIAPVQILTFPSLLVVWYSPANFPTVETCADLIDGDGDLLLVWNGWQYKIISVQQVERIVTARSAERAEAIAVEWEEYDAAQAKP